MKIYNINEFNKFKAEHPAISCPSEAIFDMPNFVSLNINLQTQREPQWRLNFMTEQGEEGQITEAQGAQFLICWVGHHYNRACAGLEEWNGRKFDCEIMDTANFYKVVYGLFPKNDSAHLIHDSFYRKALNTSSGWRDDSRNFQRSKVRKAIMDFPTKQIFVKEGENFIKAEYTNEELTEMNKQFFEEALVECGNKMATAIDRAIVAEKTAARLYAETGYRYSETVYAIEDAWIDESAFEIVKLLVPDFWQSLEEVCQLLVPNSGANLPTLSSELTSPIAQTRQYKKSIRKEVKNFEATFHIESNNDNADDDDENSDRVEEIKKNIKQTVLTINGYREVIYSEEKVNELVDDLFSYYMNRKARSIWMNKAAD